MAIVTREQNRELNRKVFEALETPGMEKEAADGINDYTRLKIREEGVYRRHVPMQTLNDDELDRRVDAVEPYKIVDKEPDNPPAAGVPFGSLPMNWLIDGPRYAVHFQRLQTKRFQADVITLKTWIMDIRQVISDNAMKDLMAEEDAGWFAAVDAALGGAANATNPVSGVVQWETISGPPDRNGLLEADKIMPKAPGHLRAHTKIVNNVTIYEIMKMDRLAWGGDKAQDVFVNGWTMTRFMDADWMVTIKRDLVPDNSIYMFASNEFIGKSYAIEDITMAMKKEWYMFQFFMYECIGGAIANTYGLARADFVP